MMNSGRPRRCAQGRLDALPGQDRRRRAGGGDDHVGLGERGVELGPRHDRAADVGGQRLGVGGGAAADGDPLRLLRGEVPRRQLGHLAGADDEHRRVAQVADDLARQAERRVADRHRAFGQLGLAPHALAGGERGVEQAVEERAGRVLIGRGRVGLLHLAEDLRLADDERIEPGGDPEQVAGGVGFAAGVDVRPQIVGRHGAGRRQEAGQSPRGRPRGCGRSRRARSGCRSRAAPPRRAPDRGPASTPRRRDRRWRTPAARAGRWARCDG